MIYLLFSFAIGIPEDGAIAETIDAENSHSEFGMCMHDSFPGFPQNYRILLFHLIQMSVKFEQDSQVQEHNFDLVGKLITTKYLPLFMVMSSLQLTYRTNKFTKYLSMAVDYTEILHMAADAINIVKLWNFVVLN